MSNPYTSTLFCRIHPNGDVRGISLPLTKLWQAWDIIIMKIKYLALAISAVAAIPVTPASAIQILVTYNGVVTSGQDPLARFFPAGTDLVGKELRIDVTVDLDTPGATITRTSQTNEIGGGALAGTLTPLSAAVTMNGNTLINDAFSSGGYSIFKQPGYDGLYASAVSQKVVGNFFYVNQLVVRAEGTQPFIPSLEFTDFFSSASGGSGVFFFQTIEYPAYIFRENTGAEFTITSVSVAPYTATIDPIGGVPEPASWALLIAGFGLTGAAMRRRRAALG